MIAGTQGVWACLQLFLVLPSLASVTTMKEETNTTETVACIVEKLSWQTHAATAKHGTHTYLMTDVAFVPSLLHMET